MVDDYMIEQLRAATELLEAVAVDRSPLEGLTDAERVRFLNAAGDVFCPDVEERRQRSKARRKRARAQRLAAAESVLEVTGIRTLRAKPVFTTPNVFPPEGVLEAGDDLTEDLTESLTEGLSGDRPGAPSTVDPDGRTIGREDTPAAAPPAAAGDTSSAGGPTLGVADDAGQGARSGRSQPTAEEQHCYVCKIRYREIHHFYDQLCPPCAELNERKRTESADLRGRVALLTGGRVKIGYQAGIKLLRAGAHLIVTTRFPRDAAVRYAGEVDFENWGHRLEIHGLDLRHTPSVEHLCRHIVETHDRLDFIVNNACQTVRRPPEFYRHMMDLEMASLGAMPSDARALLAGVDGVRGVDLLGSSAELLESAALTLSGAGVPASVRDDGPLAGVMPSAEMSQAPLLPEEHEPRHHLFPEGRLDQDLQQVDLRGRNSWRLSLHEVSSVELLETQLVNAVAPFVLNARLKPLMLRTPERDKHIVNVSAVEGQFYRRFKTTRHPHTNMAKAALNMMTRTSAADYHADGIHMNSVDTGWVSDEDPVEIAERKTAEHRFHPPLDIVDGAARIVDPIIDGHNTGTHVWGQFLKDYRPTDW